MSIKINSDLFMCLNCERRGGLLLQNINTYFLNSVLKSLQNEKLNNAALKSSI